MSRSALALVHEADSAKSSLAGKASGVRVSHPGDASELEADRVADTVSQGGRVAGWSLSATSFDGVHRQAAPAQPTASLTEIAGKVGEALLATPTGKKALDSVTSVVTSPAGLVVTGSTAVGVFAALGKAGKPLPAQLPAIPLDFIRPGLTVKLTWNGPVNQPTDGSITISYSPKAAEQKPTQSATEKQRAENATMAADQAKLHMGPQEKPAVGPLANPPRKSLTDQMFEKWQMDKLKAIGNFAKPKGAAPPAATPPVPAPAAEKTPDLKHAPVPAPAAAHDASKKEEIPVQRKAETAGPISTGSASVDSVLRSSGQPLDRATRREMESRIGYDFSHVRLHTDAQAGQSAQQLSAKAYTVGSNVVFAPGRFAPQTSEGRHLLAHELTHVVQQTTTPERAHPAVRPVARHVQRAWTMLDIPGAQWLIDKVRGIRGYKLACTVVGHDLFDETKQYERNATTVTKGILELVPGGDKIYAKLQDAGKAIETAFNWLGVQLKDRNLTPEGLMGTVEKAVAAFKEHPWDNRDEVIRIIEEPIKNLIDLGGVIAKKVLDFILQGLIDTFGETGKKVWAFFQRAAGVISDIAANPLQFGKNLLKAVGEGFKGFFANIWEHLSTGVKTWIYEELDLPKDIKMPEDFTLGSMFRLLLQVLGLTWAHWRPQLVEKLQPLGGETVVYFFETLADKAGDVIKRIREQGFSAIKDMIVEQAGDIFNSLVDNLKSWIAEEFIKRGLELIAKLSNPAGEVIKIIEAIIDTVMFVIDKAKQLAKLINTVVDALADIVAGNTGPAAKKVEDSLAQSIPLLLRFIAGQFGLSGIGKDISKIIHKIRDPLDKLIGRLLDGIVKKITPLWEKGKAAFEAKLQNIKDWWTKPAKFNYGDEEHEIVVEGEGDKPEVFVKSEKTRLRDFLKDHNAGPKQTKRAMELAKGLNWKIGKEDSLSKKEAGYNNYMELQKLMDHLKSKYPQMSQVKDKNPVVAPLGSADYSEAFLTPQLITGSPPDKSEPGPPAWEDLGVYLPPEEPHYVRGHLINQELGGRGDWTNMMPITNAANGMMAKNVEEVLKTETANKNNTYFYHYKVQAHYKNRTVKLPPETAKVGRSKAAAKRLVSLTWTVKDAIFDADDNKFKITGKEAKHADGSVLPKDIRDGSVEANRGFDPG
jgi:hypothetical protein